MADPKQNSKPKPKKKGQEERDVDEVFEAPVITREPTSRQVTLGGKLSLRINATGKPLPSYQWYLNGRKVSGANTDRLIVNKTRRDNGGAYTCEVKNYAGKVMSRAAMVSFLVERVPEIVVEPSVASIPIGKPFKFRVALPEKEALKKFKLQWTFNGKRINGATGLELQFVQVKKKYEGEYKVVILVAGDIHASNCVKLLALPAEGVAEIQPALTREKTAFIAAPPKASFFFDPLEEDSEGEGDASDPSLQQWQDELKAQTQEEPAHLESEEQLADVLDFSLSELPTAEGEAAAPSPNLARKKEFLERLLQRWAKPSARRAA